MMHFYFDTLDEETSNLDYLSTTPESNFYLTSNGTVIKQTLRKMKRPVSELVNCEHTPGIYYIDVNGDPCWWTGLSNVHNGPTDIFTNLPEHIVDYVKRGKLRLVIGADKEGGPFQHKALGDGFAAITKSAIARGLPPLSVYIMQGSQLVVQHYEEWLETSGSVRMFEVAYSNHFLKIFLDGNLPYKPLIQAAMYVDNAKSFNSLNRVHRPHRAAHVTDLGIKGLLDEGIVSCNEVKEGEDLRAEELIGKENYARHHEFTPRFIDGDWSINNAANSYNAHVYSDTLLTVVTETIYFDNSVFLTEKLFKPITMGHPFIVLGSRGTLAGLRSLGFRTDFNLFSKPYDLIVDPVERFHTVQQNLIEWIGLSKQTKVNRLLKAFPAIQHNFTHARMKDFYTDAIVACTDSAEKYFEKL
jgi:hypothetical protein|tara:strand:+ start:2266 stop:3507 length:1242 start_codon:yes stop_codon:yes gene_type:complete